MYYTLLQINRGMGLYKKVYKYVTMVMFLVAKTQVI